MENDKTTIQAKVKKRSSIIALLITVCSLIFVAVMLFWGLKVGYSCLISDPKGPEDVRIRTAYNWFNVPLYYHDSGEPREFTSDFLGVTKTDILYLERNYIKKGNIITIASVCFILIAGPIITDLLHCKMCKNTKLTITDTQATGSYSSFLTKKKLQLPLNKINNLTVTNSFMDKIRGGETLGLATASGVIKIHFIRNAEEIVSHFTTLTANSGSLNAPVPVPSKLTQTTSEKLEELLKLKNSGLITEEEYLHKREDILSKL